MQLIAVVLGAPTSAKRFESARALLDYGFASYKINKLATKDTEVAKAKVMKGTEEEVSAVCGEDYSELIAKNDPAKTDVNTEIFENLTAPIKAGDKIGTMHFMRDGKEEGSVDIVAADDVEKKSIAKIIGSFFAMLTGRK